MVVLVWGERRDTLAAGKPRSREGADAASRHERIKDARRSGEQGRVADRRQRVECEPR